MLFRRRLEIPDGQHIDLAPMLDFVLNLLIFFIIATSFVKETGARVVRPEAETAQYQETGNILIAVLGSGEVWMDRKPVDPRSVRAAIERLHLERPTDTVVILADEAAPVGVVADVMDQVRLGGIDDIALGARTAKSG